MMDNIAVAQDFSSARRRRDVFPAGVDKRLSRLGATFTSLNTVMLAGDSSPAPYDQWWGVVRDALPIRARTARGRRIKAAMLLAIIRQSSADGPACELARLIATDLTARSEKKKKPLSPTDIKIQYFVEQGVSSRAAKVLTALSCESADNVFRHGTGEFRVWQNCGRITSVEVSAFVQERQCLKDGR